MSCKTLQNNYEVITHANTIVVSVLGSEHICLQDTS